MLILKKGDGKKMKRIYPYFNIIVSVFYFAWFLIFLSEFLKDVSISNFSVTIILLLCSIIYPGIYITYDNVSYTLHIYFYKTAVFYKDITMVSSYGFRFLSSYFLWSSTKNIFVILPFCRKKTDELFEAIRKINPNCKFII